MLFEVPKREEVIELHAELTVPLHNISSITFVDALMGSLGFGPVFSISGLKYSRFNVSLHEVWKAIDLHLDVDKKCHTRAGIAKFSVPGFVQDTYKRLGQGHGTAVFPLKLQTAVADGQQSLLELFLDPECSYTVSFRVDWSGILGQLLRFYIMQLPAYFAAVVVLRLLPLSTHRKLNLLDHVAVNVGALCVIIASR